MTEQKKTVTLTLTQKQLDAIIEAIIRGCDLADTYFDCEIDADGSYNGNDACLAQPVLEEGYEALLALGLVKRNTAA